MTLFSQIILYTALSGVLSLIGGVILLGKSAWVRKSSVWFVAFAAGALLAIAFLDLLPEAFEYFSGESSELLIWTLLGLVAFFLFERVILHFHGHYHESGESEEHHHPTPLLMMAGDALHNFLDGITIAATFLANPAVGVVTAVGVAFHELPQEIGDFSVLLHHGWSKMKTLWVNIAISLVSVIGAMLAYFLRDLLMTVIPQLLAVAAGNFIYIAASDLIPELSRDPKLGGKISLSVLLLLGIASVYVFGRLF